MMTIVDNNEDTTSVFLCDLEYGDCFTIAFDILDDVGERTLFMRTNERKEDFATKDIELNIVCLENGTAYYLNPYTRVRKVNASLEWVWED
jgi:hypothetical protein